MPISPLPEATARQLGSTLVIISPVVLLKELLDNAIDSGATSVDVLVSSNTVDRIEVRDNGHGISPDDFDCLGRPGHTSKLRSFNELSALGGSTLGFRGSALASANAVADVSLTTRVSTEHVATVVALAKGGGISKERRASAPVGTTVSVTGLFSRLPVRLQVSTKEAPKSLAKMKDLLQAYILAKPWIRLRFTVLKNPNLSWSYAPAPNGTAKEAAMQLFGIELASQCTFETSSSETLQEDAKPSVPQNGRPPSARLQAGPVFEAFLPVPSADARKISKGAFVSVDARPVSPARGTAKKLVSIFKRHLGDQLSQVCSETTLKEPFIQLNVQCPPGSYDVNIEPSKEEVLFTDEPQILSQFESFLSSIYCAAAGSCDSPQRPIITMEKDVGSHRAVTHEAPSHRPPSQISRLSDPHIQPALNTHSAASSWRVDMSSGFDGLSDDDEARNDADGSDGSQQNIRHGPDDDMSTVLETDTAEGDSRDISKEGLNPWSIAKLISTNRRASPAPKRFAQEVKKNTRPPPTENDDTNGFDGIPLLATQEPRSRGGMELQLVHQSQLENPASQGRRLQDVFERAPRRAPAHSARVSDRNEPSRRNHGLQSPPTSSPHEHPCDRGGTKRGRRLRHAASLDNSVQSQISFDKSNRRRQRRNQADLNLNQQVVGFSRLEARPRTSPSTPRMNIDEVNLAMTDSVAVEPSRRRREEASPPGQPLPCSSHDDGGTLTQARQREGSDEGAAQPTLPADDPRAHLIKQQRLMTKSLQRRPRRLKTEQLPLETIPRDSQTCALLLTMSADGLPQLFSNTSRFDTWLVDGKLKGAFEKGTGLEDTAVLVEPLLARMDVGQLQGRPGCQEGATSTRTDGSHVVSEG